MPQMTHQRPQQQGLPKSVPGAGLVVILLAGLCCAGMAHAVGLGGINVLSRLGQPFSAEIALINASRDDLSSLKVNLAPPAAYDAANLKFDPALNAFRLSLERRPNGTPYIRATSTRPVSEPYLDVLVEITTQEGRFQRAYAALLDLPDSPSTAVAAPAAIPGAVAPAPRAESAPASPRASQAPRRAARPPAADDSGKVVALAPSVPLPAARTPAAPAITGPAPAAPKAAEPVARPEAAKPAAPAAPAPVTATPAAPEAVPAPVTAEQPKAAVPKPVPGEAEKVAVAEPPLPAPKQAVMPPATPTPQQAGATDAGSNQGLLLGGAALALLAGLGGLWAWRRRSAAPESILAPAEPALHAEMPPRSAAAAAPVVVADAGVARAGTPATAAADPYEFTQSGPTVSNVTDSVDPIDEAKVHLEYGQRDRAETILREALSKQPGREDIQLLLLEVLAGRGDTDGFNQLAGRIHKQTGGLGDHWKQVMSMGYALDPGHALYSPTDGAPASNASGLAYAPGNLGGAADLELDDRGAAIEMDKTMVLPRPGAQPTAPAPGNLGGAADLELDDRDAGFDMDKTMVLARPGTRPTTPAPAIAPLPDMNFELPPAKAASDEVKPAVATAAPSAPDLPGLDFKVDLPGIDLPPDVAADTAAAPAGNNPQYEEVQKKLMLARAYREMGDKEGALELLREVEREGDSTQLAEMRDLLQTLS